MPVEEDPARAPIGPVAGGTHYTAAAPSTSSSSKPNHVPYRDLKLTRILQDALFIIALYQYLSRTKLIKILTKLIPTEVDSVKKPSSYSHDQDDLCGRAPSNVGSSQSEVS
ncbi:Kinesin heavy chain [Hordeum vulgare]|nr:Kinesin heavy chain [Hordeum vulgare]